MTDRIETYDVTGIPSIEIVGQTGDIVVRPSDEPRVRVVLRGNTEEVEATQIDASPGSVSVRSRESEGLFLNKPVDVIVTTPPGSYLKVNLAAGQVRVLAPLAEVSISTGSADVRVSEPVGSATIKVVSGHVSLDEVAGDADVASASGNIKIPSARHIIVNTASGNVRIGEAARTISVKSASGNVTVKRFGGTEIDVATMSGDASIGLTPGIEVRASIKTLSGDFRNRIKPDDCERTESMALRVKSFSGDVTLRSAS
jgi:DUF4097 and DUF4098 domain-containing protein YvlB